MVLKVLAYHTQCFFLFTLFHASPLYWSESRWHSPWFEDLAEIFLELKNLSVGLKWRSQPCLRFLFSFFRHMKIALVQFIILIFKNLVSIFLNLHILFGTSFVYL